MSLFLRRFLAGIAVCMLLALLIAPQTRWIMQKQMLISIGRYHLLPFNNGAYTTSPDSDRRKIEVAAASAPNDFGLQYAAVNGDGHAAVAAGMRGLVSRFPNEPALYANILRYDTLGAVLLVRPEGALLTGIKPNPQWHPTPPTPAALTAFDRTAAAGERVDPDNAYFPLMRAVGLLAAHRDADAEAAVRRAGEKTAWREYIPEDVQSRWRLHQIAFDDTGVIPQVSVASDTLLPQYQRMRDVVQVLTYRAMQKEQAGDVAGGLSLRESLRRCGDLMRVQSNFLIGAIIGSSLCEISCLRPGGAPPLSELPFKATIGEVTNRFLANVQVFADYARRHGRSDLAAKALAEADVRAHLQTVLDYAQSQEDAALKPLFRAINWWTADVAVLANVFWLLALWALTGLAYAGRRLFARAPERAAALAWFVLAAAFVTALIILAGSLVLIAVNILTPPGYLWGVSVLLLLTVGVGLALRWTVPNIPRARLRRRDMGWALVWLGVLTFAFYGMFALLQWQTEGIWATWATHYYFLPSSNFGATPYDDARRSQLQWSAIGTALIAPLLLMLGATLATRLRPAPRLARFGASLRVLAPATACVLLIVYGGLVLGTLRQEAVVRGPLEATVKGSGQYFAARAGLPWPGPVN